MTWLPIETAPRDGTPFLAKGGEQDNYEPEMDGERPTDIAVIWWDVEGEGWRFCLYDSGFYGAWRDPVQWMPLPDTACLGVEPK